MKKYFAAVAFMFFLADPALATVPATSSGTFTEIAITSDTTLTNAQCKGQVVTMSAATEDIAVTLPDATKNLSVSFHGGVYGMVIKPQSTDTISECAAAGDYYVITPAGFCRLYAAQTGTWTVVSNIGGYTYAGDNNLATSGLESYHSFDTADCSGTTLTSVPTDSFWNLTITGGTCAGLVAGKSGQAFSSSSVSTYASSSSIGDRQTFETGKQKTISFWYYADSTGQSSLISFGGCGKTNTDTNQGVLVMTNLLNLNHGIALISCVDGGNNYTPYVEDESGLITAGVWKHYVFRVIGYSDYEKGVAAESELWIDNVNLSYSATWKYFYVRSITPQIAIGKNGDLGVIHLNGDMDELRIYERWLTDDEINYLYNNPGGP